MASDWPRTFLQPGCFCLAYSYTIKNFPLKIISFTVQYVINPECEKQAYVCKQNTPIHIIVPPLLYKIFKICKLHEILY